jgi:chromosome segregation ATPase
MGRLEDNIKQAQDIIDRLQQQLDAEKILLEEYKKKQKELFDNYTKPTLDINEIDNESMDLEDKIRDSEAKIKGLDARILNRKRSLLIYRFNLGNL